MRSRCNCPPSFAIGEVKGGFRGWFWRWFWALVFVLDFTLVFGTHSRTLNTQAQVHCHYSSPNSTINHIAMPKTPKSRSNTVVPSPPSIPRKSSHSKTSATKKMSGKTTEMKQKELPNASNKKPRIFIS